MDIKWKKQTTFHLNTLYNLFPFANQPVFTENRIIQDYLLQQFNKFIG